MDRTFREQMDDLGVEIVATNKTSWYSETPGRQLSRSWLGDKISVNRSCISVGKGAVDMLVPGKVYDIGVKEISGYMCLTFRPDPKGVAVGSCRGSASHRMGYQALVDWLVAQGIKYGRYRLKKVKGGFLGVPV